MSRQVLAVASAGGHWEQLMLLRPAFDGATPTYVSTTAGLDIAEGLEVVLTITDCNRNKKLSFLLAICQAIRIIRTQRPQCIVSTGALPGLIFIALGRAMGIRTIWIESIANAEKLSMSGRYARRIASKSFVQWPDLASGESVYTGSVI